MKIPEIVITYEPSMSEIDRICGHTFEAFDLYLFLKDYLPSSINIKIVIQDRTKISLIEKAFNYKYNINFQKIKKDIIFKKNKIIGKIIINTSGLEDFKFKKYRYQYFISFRCNYLFPLLHKKNLFYFYDFRVYKPFDKNIPSNAINSIKKFYFKYYKNKSYKSQDRYLFYLNSNLRKIDIDYYIKKFKEKQCLFDSGNKFNSSKVIQAPVKDFFEKFSVYVYTPIQRQFDCSPRLLTECKYYDKKIIFAFNFKDYAGPDYGDTGLYWRWHDIQNNFNSLIYDKNDELLSFLMNLLNIN